MRDLAGGYAAVLVVATALLVFTLNSPCQTAPPAPDRPWHSEQEKGIEQGASHALSPELKIDAANIYSLSELVDLAESHNPETRLAWESARSEAASLGVARSELYPTIAAAALSHTSRSEVYLNTRFYRQTLQEFDLALDLNYTVFDFGARAGRIDAAKAQLLGADFAFNDVHRRLIYRVAAGYYQLLNASGQVAAARASLTNAQTVEKAAEARLRNGLATLPDELEAKSAAAQADYDLQAALGTEEIAHGELATALGSSPTETIQVEPIDRLTIPETLETAVDAALDRAFQERPDLMQQIAEIRAANAGLKQARAACYPTLGLEVRPDAQALYGLQQSLPWGNTADLDGGVVLGMHWTVFDGGLRRSQEAKARADVHAAEAQADALRDNIENEIWTAYSNLKTAMRQRQAATALLVAANQSYNAAIESYHDGVRNLLDVTAAQKTLAAARSADVLARAQVLSSLAALAFQTGDSIQTPPARTQP
jgi:outer membrane protein TolC